MKHFLIADFLIRLLTASCELMKKGNEEMIFHFLTAFFLIYFPLPYSTPSALRRGGGWFLDTSYQLLDTGATPSTVILSAAKDLGKSRK